MNTELERLGLTLIHSLWELGLVWLGFRAAMGLLRRGSSRHRYTAACAALALCGFLPWVTFVRLGSFGAYSAVAFGEPQGPPPAHASAGILGVPGPIASNPAFTDALNTILPWLVLFWAVGCTWGMFRLLIDWISIRRLADTPLNPVPEALAHRCADLARQLGIRRVVRLGESLLVDVPSVIGWLKPAILVPIGAFSGLSPAQVEGILVHELAHVVRHDYPIRLLQSICGIVFFYHPVIRTINDHINRERENACDDMAVALTGDPVAFAEALAILEGARAPRLALAASGDGHLLSRVRRLLGQSPTPDKIRARNAWVTLCGIVLYAAFFLLTPRGPMRAEPPGGGPATLGLYAASAHPQIGFRAMTLQSDRTALTLYVAATPDLTLEDIAHAAVIHGRNGQPVLRIKFTREGREKFKTLSRQRSAGGTVGREAILVDGTCISAPFLRQEIDAPLADVDGSGPRWREACATFWRGLPSEKRN